MHITFQGMEISWLKNRRESRMSNITVDSGYSGSVGSTNGIGNHEPYNDVVQMCGIMQKKPFGHQSTKWSRRFFVLKEGFLFYYAENEKKVFETKRVFNIHPKGVIPLGNCLIEDVSQPGMPHCISVSHPDQKTHICFAATDEESRKMWIKAMDKATKVTIENTGLSETMIKSLQEQSLQLARERQEYVDKFISEAEELGAERELREALEEFNQELEEENARIESLVEDLKHAHEEVKNELLSATESSKQLELEREEMRKRTDELHAKLEALSNERTAIIQKLQDREAREGNSVEQNAELARQLAAIEEKAQSLEKDKENIREKLEENQRMSKDLLREREAISQEAEELKTEMQNLSEEKKLAQEELKEEVVARMKLQKELGECKAALKRLEEKALKNSPTGGKPQGNSTDPDKTSRRSDDDGGNEQIMRDVKSLREFFENCARDNKIDEKPVSDIKRTRQSASLRIPHPTTFVHEQLDTKRSSSPRRTFSRVSLLKRRNQTVRCTSMVFDENFSISALVRDPVQRRSAMLSRHKRSLSLTGQKRSIPPRKNDS